MNYGSRMEVAGGLAATRTAVGMVPGAWYPGAAVNATDVRKADNRITAARKRNEVNILNRF